MQTFKIKEYYESKTSPGMAIFIKKITKRGPKEFLLNVDWQQKNNIWKSIGINQDIVVNTDDFDKRWSKLDI